MSRGATGSPGRPERGGVWGAISGPPILIGLDVGGTTIAAGAVTRDGGVLVDERVATRDAKAVGTPAAIEALVERVRAAVAARGLTVAGIGVGVPGPVDAEAGVVGDPAPHAPDLVDVPLAQRLGARFGIPAFVDNDVNALALGEWRFGAGRGARSLVVLAAGTGFGGGVILDGRLVRGVAGFGGEFGHAPVKFDGPPCWCGGRGCLAVYASGRGITEAARARVAREAGAAPRPGGGGGPPRGPGRPPFPDGPDSGAPPAGGGGEGVVAQRAPPRPPRAASRPTGWRAGRAGGGCCGRPSSPCR